MNNGGTIDVYNNSIPQWLAQNRLKTVCRLLVPPTTCRQKRDTLACLLIGLCLFTQLQSWIEPAIIQMVAWCHRFYIFILLIHSSCIVSIPPVRWAGQKWNVKQSHCINFNKFWRCQTKLCTVSELCSCWTC